jgi:hypothetical protein
MVEVNPRHERIVRTSPPGPPIAAAASEFSRCGFARLADVHATLPNPDQLRRPLWPRGRQCTNIEAGPVAGVSATFLEIPIFSPTCLFFAKHYVCVLLEIIPVDRLLSFCGTFSTGFEIRYDPEVATSIPALRRL